MLCSQIMLPPIIVKTCEGAGIVQSKTDCNGEMVVAFTIKQKLFNGKPILLIGAFSIATWPFTY